MQVDKKEQSWRIGVPEPKRKRVELDMVLEVSWQSTKYRVPVTAKN